jgi:DNA-binding beta-propeller fold protein YncE
MSHFLKPAILVCFLACGMPVTGAVKNHPIAAAKPANGSLFVVTAEGTVYAINLGLKSGSVAGHFSLPVQALPSDMTYGTVNAQPTLFIPSSYTIGSRVNGQVKAYSAAGAESGSWNIAHVITGIAIDQSRDTIYFTSGDSPEIYALSTQSKSAPHFVCEVNGAVHLGAIAVDGAGQKAYVADIDAGTVYAVDLQSHHSEPIASISKPQAFALSADGSQLFVADAAKKRLVAINLKAPQQAPRILTPTGLQSPSGLAWVDATHLAVTDQQTGAVLVVDLSGTLLYSVALP